MKLYDQIISNILALCRHPSARKLPVCQVDWLDSGKENLIFRQDMAYELGRIKILTEWRRTAP